MRLVALRHAQFLYCKLVKCAKKYIFHKSFITLVKVVVQYQGSVR